MRLVRLMSKGRTRKFTAPPGQRNPLGPAAQSTSQTIAMNNRLWETNPVDLTELILESPRGS
jgi:hypothetical protein